MALSDTTARMLRAASLPDEKDCKGTGLAVTWTDSSNTEQRATVWIDGLQTSERVNGAGVLRIISSSFAARRTGHVPPVLQFEEPQMHGQAHGWALVYNDLEADDPVSVKLRFECQVSVL